MPPINFFQGSGWYMDTVRLVMHLCYCHQLAKKMIMHYKFYIESMSYCFFIYLSVLL